MNQAPTTLDYIVVITKAVLAGICVIAICCAMFFKNYSDPATLSALFLLTGTLVGNLRGSMSFANPFSKGDPDQPIETTISQPVNKPVPVEAAHVTPPPDPIKP